MTDNPDLWEVRKFDAGMVLELHAWSNPSLVLVQGESRVGVDSVKVKGLVVSLSEGAADLAEVLAVGEEYQV
jgi:hypothetical protein